MLIEQIIIPKLFRGTDYSGVQKVLAVNKETGYMLVWFTGGNYWAGIGTTGYANAQFTVFPLLEKGRTKYGKRWGIGIGKDFKPIGRLSKATINAMKDQFLQYGINTDDLIRNKTKIYGEFKSLNIDDIIEEIRGT